MNKINKLKSLLFLIVVVITSSCSSDNEPEPEVKSSEKSILSFSFKSLNPEVVATINESQKTITATVANGTNVKELVPTISISEKASVSPASLQTIDFTNPVVFTVTAEDGTTAAYTVTITKSTDSDPDPEVKSSEKSILSFSFKSLDPEVVATINESQKTITATVANGTNVKELVPTISISEKASVSPASLQTIDFTNPVVFTVTAEDGTTAAYTVTITESTEVSFTVNPLSITSIDQGGVIFFGGSGFGEFTNNKIVLTKKSDTSLKYEYPAVAPSHNSLLFFRIGSDIPLGDYTAVVFIGAQSKTLPETITIIVPAPKITSLSKTEVIRSQTFVISGSDFMNTGNVVRLHNNNTSITLPIISQSTTSIEVRVPASTPVFSQYVVSVTSNGRTTYFNDEKISVIIDPTFPVITSISKTSYSRGETMIITGQNLKKPMAVSNINFIPFHGGTTLVRTGIPNDAGTEITYTIPGDFPTGTYLIVVEVDFNFSEEYTDVIQIKP